MNTKIASAIELMARDKPNEEICGFIYHTLDVVNFFPCENISSEKDREFEISSDDYISCTKKGKILAIYHSHIASSEYGANLTPADKELADIMELPIRVFSLSESRWGEYIPTEYKISLVGEPFLWGEKDCFGLVRTFLRQEKGIYINDYLRDDSFQSTDNNQIIENIEKEGYVDTGYTCLLKKHDVLLFNSGRVNIQHMAIYMGNSRILHHPLHMLSNIEIMNQKWHDRLRHVLRHKNDAK